ncbi:MAG TPA: hypothetical protein VL424_06280 [Pararobbsia sp.]|jgi:hypothetical protein|nr:hypothetical protein [Pararobbsia sp.]
MVRTNVGYAALTMNHELAAVGGTSTSPRVNISVMISVVAALLLSRAALS